jgi:DNA-binding transcriptional MerR regulator
MSKETSYSLEELAKITGLKTRTIRHYIQQRLLLGPDSLGRTATYSDYHRDRLLVIKELRRHRYSIGDIRKTFRHARPDEEIRIEILPLPEGEVPSRQEVESALGFVQEQQAAMEPLSDVEHVAREPVVRKQTAPSPSSSGPIGLLLEQLRNLSGQRRGRPRTRSEEWVRLAVTPDLEIHVRGELGSDQKELYEEIADHMRHILLGGTQR